MGAGGQPSGPMRSDASSVADAWSAADEAARRAGVVIREADTVESSHRAASVIDVVWSPDAASAGGAGAAGAAGASAAGAAGTGVAGTGVAGTGVVGAGAGASSTGAEPPSAGSLMAPNLLRAMWHADDYVVIAETADGSAIGVCVGFFGSPVRAELHSHIAGVTAGHAGRGVGLALKLHQRAWVLERGVATITWTYDPVIRRNARFNLRTLGARAVEYLPDFYGPMTDARNAGLVSDRMLVRWDLRQEPPFRPPAFDDAEEWVAVSDGGSPIVLARPRVGASGMVSVPPDVEAVRGRHPDAASAWPLILREFLGGALATGTHRIDVDAQGRYRMEATG